MTPRSMIPRKIQITRRNVIKIENIFIHWSVVQASSNDEKTGGQKSCWTFPSKISFKIHTSSTLLVNYKIYCIKKNMRAKISYFEISVFPVFIPVSVQREEFVGIFGC